MAELEHGTCAHYGCSEPATQQTGETTWVCEQHGAELDALIEANDVGGMVRWAVRLWTPLRQGGVRKEREKARSEMELRPEVLAFARLMEAKLRKHDDRPGWKDADPRLLIRRCEIEVGKMSWAFGNGLLADAAADAVDVANFAMMVADVLDTLQPESEE